MPIVTIETNVHESDIPAGFVKEVSSSVAASLGKSESVSTAQ